MGGGVTHTHTHTHARAHTHTHTHTHTHSSMSQTSRMWRTQSIPALDGRADYTRCFRLNDLEQGELLGEGFYGSVYKVGGANTHVRDMRI